MPIKFQCDCCGLLDGQDDPDYPDKVIVEQVVILTLDSEGRKTPNTAKEKVYLCKSCSGPLFKLTRGLEMYRLRDFNEWYRKIYSRVNINDNQGTDSDVGESSGRKS